MLTLRWVFVYHRRITQRLHQVTVILRSISQSLQKQKLGLYRITSNINR
jgi:hypothetical protein